MRLPFIPTGGACRVCGRDVTPFRGEFLCEDCHAHPPRFDRLASALRFEGEARRMTLDFKFNSHLWMRDDFADWLEAAVRARFDPAAIDAIVPMPISVWHRLDRGFNQSRVLAFALARRFSRRLLAGALGRTGRFRRQSGLNEDERRENVKGTFICRAPELVRGRTLLVIDDIVTTGATLSECAGTLKAAGAARVWCATLARTVRESR